MDWSIMPPLAALRAFEATARHGTFSAAARELNVTPAAVNQQVRSLERDLATPLVQREGRGVALTAAGNSLARDLSAGFTRIRDGVDRIAELGATRPLRITMTPTFGTHWFMPRYSSFREAHPEIDLVLHPTGELVDLNAGTHDIAIRFGDGNWPGLESELLFESCFMIVAAPELLKSVPEQGLEALDQLPWFTETGADEVNRWRTAQGMTGRGPSNISELPGHMILEALRDGHGVGTVTHEFVWQDIEAGRLVAVWQDCRRGTGYNLVHRPGVLRPAAKSFAQWIKREAAKTAKARQNQIGM